MWPSGICSWTRIRWRTRDDVTGNATSAFLASPTASDEKHVRRRREWTGKTTGADRLPHSHTPVGPSRRGDGQSTRRAGLRSDEGNDRVHRPTVDAEALTVSHAAPDGEHRQHPVRT